MTVKLQLIFDSTAGFWQYEVSGVGGDVQWYNASDGLLATTNAKEVDASIAYFTTPSPASETYQLHYMGLGSDLAATPIVMAGTSTVNLATETRNLLSSDTAPVSTGSSAGVDRVLKIESTDSADAFTISEGFDDVANTSVWTIAESVSGGPTDLFQIEGPFVGVFVGESFDHTDAKVVNFEVMVNQSGEIRGTFWDDDPFEINIDNSAGSSVAAVDVDGTTQLIDADTITVLATIELGTDIDGLEDGSYLITDIGSDATYKVFDIEQIQFHDLAAGSDAALLDLPPLDYGPEPNVYNIGDTSGFTNITTGGTYAVYTDDSADPAVTYAQKLDANGSTPDGAPIELAAGDVTALDSLTATDHWYPPEPNVYNIGDTSGFTNITTGGTYAVYTDDSADPAVTYAQKLDANGSTPDGAPIELAAGDVTALDSLTATDHWYPPEPNVYNIGDTSGFTNITTGGTYAVYTDDSADPAVTYAQKLDANGSTPDGAPIELAAGDVTALDSLTATDHWYPPEPNVYNIGDTSGFTNITTGGTYAVYTDDSADPAVTYAQKLDANGSTPDGAPIELAAGDVTALDSLTATDHWYPPEPNVYNIGDTSGFTNITTGGTYAVYTDDSADPAVTYAQKLDANGSTPDGAPIELAAGDVTALDSLTATDHWYPPEPNVYNIGDTSGFTNITTGGTYAVYTDDSADPAVTYAQKLDANGSTPDGAPIELAAGDVTALDSLTATDHWYPPEPNVYNIGDTSGFTNITTGGTYAVYTDDSADPAVTYAQKLDANGSTPDGAPIELAAGDVTALDSLTATDHWYPPEPNVYNIGDTSGFTNITTGGTYAVYTDDSADPAVTYAQKLDANGSTPDGAPIELAAGDVTALDSLTATDHWYPPEPNVYNIGDTSGFTNITTGGTYAVYTDDSADPAVTYAQKLDANGSTPDGAPIELAAGDVTALDSLTATDHWYPPEPNVYNIGDTSGFTNITTGGTYAVYTDDSADPAVTYAQKLDANGSTPDGAPIELAAGDVTALDSLTATDHWYPPEPNVYNIGDTSGFTNITTGGTYAVYTDDSADPAVTYAQKLDANGSTPDGAPIELAAGDVTALDSLTATDHWYPPEPNVYNIGDTSGFTNITTGGTYAVYTDDSADPAVTYAQKLDANGSTPDGAPIELAAGDVTALDSLTATDHWYPPEPNVYNIGDTSGFTNITTGGTYAVYTDDSADPAVTYAQKLDANGSTPDGAPIELAAGDVTALDSLTATDHWYPPEPNVYNIGDTSGFTNITTGGTYAVYTDDSADPAVTYAQKLDANGSTPDGAPIELAAGDVTALDSLTATDHWYPPEPNVYNIGDTSGFTNITTGGTYAVYTDDSADPAVTYAQKLDANGSTPDGAPIELAAGDVTALDSLTATDHWYPPEPNVYNIGDTSGFTNITTGGTYAVYTDDSADPAVTYAQKLDANGSTPDGAPIELAAGDVTALDSLTATDHWYPPEPNVYNIGDTSGFTNITTGGTYAVYTDDSADPAVTYAQKLDANGSTPDGAPIELAAGDVTALDSLTATDHWYPPEPNVYNIGDTSGFTNITTGGTYAVYTDDSADPAVTYAQKLDANGSTPDGAPIELAAGDVTALDSLTATDHWYPPEPNVYNIGDTSGFTNITTGGTYAVYTDDSADPAVTYAQKLDANGSTPDGAPIELAAGDVTALDSLTATDHWYPPEPNVYNIGDTSGFTNITTGGTYAVYTDDSADPAVTYAQKLDANGSTPDGAPIELAAGDVTALDSLTATDHWYPPEPNVYNIGDTSGFTNITTGGTYAVYTDDSADPAVTYAQKLDANGSTPDGAPIELAAGDVTALDSLTATDHWYPPEPNVYNIGDTSGFTNITTGGTYAVYTDDSADPAVTYAQKLDANGSTPDGAPIELAAGDVTALDSLTATDHWYPDINPPTVESFTLDDADLIEGDTATVTLEFSEAVSGFSSADDITVQGGTLEAMTSSDDITWTGIFTPDSGTEADANSLTLSADYTDIAGNTGVTAISDNYEIDTAVPTVESFTLDDADLIEGDTATVELEFSEAVSGFSSADDITVQGGTLEAMTSSDDITWTGIFTPDSGTEADANSLTLSADYTDIAGNTGVTAISDNYEIDTAVPTVESFTLDDADLIEGETATVTLEFSEAVSGFSSADDITVQGGTLEAMTSSDDITWTGTFTPGSDIQAATHSLTLAADYTDIAGNTGVTATTNYEIDTAAPTVTSFTLNDADLIEGDTATVTLEFSEAVSGFSSADDITVQGGTLEAMTSSDDITWTGIFTPDSDIQAATHSLTLSADYTDIAGNTGVTAISDNYEIDTAVPTVESFTLDDADLIVGETATVTLEFSEAVSGFSSADDITVQGGTLEAMTSSDDITWTGIFTPDSGTEADANSLTLSADYTDIAGNTGVTAISDNYEIDTAVPTVESFTLDDADLIEGETATVTLEFSEAVSGFSSADDITVQGGTLEAMTSSDDITWTGTFTPGSDIQAATHSLTLAADYTDIAGNTGVTATTNYEIDTAAPTVTSFTLNDADLIEGETATVTLEFSEAVSGFSSADDITVQGGTLEAMTSSDDITWTGIFTPDSGTEADANSLTLSADYTDIAGNTGVTAISDNYEIDTAVPTVESFTLDDADLIEGETATVTLEFSEAVSGFSSADDITVQGGTLEAMTSSDDITWTGTFTPGSDIQAATHSLTLAADYTDIAGNTGVTATTNYEIDTAAPTVTSFTLNDADLIEGETATVTLEFSEAVSGFSSADDITVQGGTLEAMTSSDDITWTGIFTPDSGTEADANSLTLSADYTDIAGNTGVTAISDNYEIDTAVPTVESFTLDDADLIEGETATVTLEFSEAVSGFSSADDITVQGGTLEAMTSSDDITWTGIFTPDSGTEADANSLTLSADYTDIAGNTGVTAISDNYEIDTAVPTVESFTLDDADLIEGETATVTLEFSEAVSGFSSADDITVQGGTLEAMTSSDDITWTGTFTPGSDIQAATHSLTLAADYTDIAGNTGVTATTNYEIDTAAPTVTSFTLDDADLIVGDTATVELEFSEAVSGFSSADDITVQGGTLEAMTSSDDITWTGIFTPDSGTEADANSLTLSADYTDIAGNTGVTAISDNYEIDTAVPTVESFTLDDADLIEGETATVTLEFSEAVSGFSSADDITVQGGTLEAMTSSDDITWTGTFTPGSDIQAATHSLTLAADYTDIAGNTGVTATTNYEIDTAAPTVTSFTLDDADLIEGETATVTLEFSEAVSGFSSADDITVQGGTLEAMTSSDDITWTGIFTPGSGTEADANSLTLSADYTDIAGNTGVTAISDNYEIDTAVPTVESFTLDDADLIEGETATVTLEFSEAVSGFSSADDITVQGGTLEAMTSSDDITWTGIFTPDSGTEADANSLTLSADYTDIAGNTGVTAISDNYEIDTAVPTVESFTLDDADLIEGETATVTLEFSEAVSGFSSADDITVQGGTLEAMTSSDDITWTGTFTPGSDIQAATHSLTLAADYTDIAGNTGVTATTNYEIDTAAPTVTSFTLNDADLIEGETATVTLEFSEAVSGFSSADDITVQGGTLEAMTSSDDITWTGTFTPGSDIQAATHSLTLSADYTDIAGNTGVTAISDNYEIDTAVPTVESFTLDDADLIEGETATVTLEFSEAVSGFSSADDITADNGTLSDMISDDGGVTWTGTFTPDDITEAATNSLTLSATYTDNAGNTGVTAALTTSNYEIDTLAPTVESFTLDDVALYKGETATVELVFSEAVSGFISATDITADNGTLSDMTSSDDITWTGIFTPDDITEAATNSLTLADTYTDNAGNTGVTAETANYEVQTIASLSIESLASGYGIITGDASSQVVYTVTETGINDTDKVEIVASVNGEVIDPISFVDNGDGTHTATFDFSGLGDLPLGTSGISIDLAATRDGEVQPFTETYYSVPLYNSLNVASTSRTEGSQDYMDIDITFAGDVSTPSDYDIYALFDIIGQVGETVDKATVDLGNVSFSASGDSSGSDILDLGRDDHWHEPEQLEDGTVFLASADSDSVIETHGLLIQKAGGGVSVSGATKSIDAVTGEVTVSPDAHDFGLDLQGIEGLRAWSEDANGAWGSSVLSLTNSVVATDDSGDNLAVSGSIFGGDIHHIDLNGDAQNLYWEFVDDTGESVRFDLLGTVGSDEGQYVGHIVLDSDSGSYGETIDLVISSAYRTDGSSYDLHLGLSDIETLSIAPEARAKVTTFDVANFEIPPATDIVDIRSHGGEGVGNYHYDVTVEFNQDIPTDLNDPSISMSITVGDTDVTSYYAKVLGNNEITFQFVLKDQDGNLYHGPVDLVGINGDVHGSDSRGPLVTNLEDKGNFANEFIMNSVIDLDSGQSADGAPSGSFYVTSDLANLAGVTPGDGPGADAYDQLALLVDGAEGDEVSISGNEISVGGAVAYTIGTDEGGAYQITDASSGAATSLVGFDGLAVVVKDSGTTAADLLGSDQAQDLIHDEIQVRLTAAEISETESGLRAANKFIYGSMDDDTIVVGGVDTTAADYAGDVDGGGSKQIAAGGGDDVIHGHKGVDHVHGGAGDDTIATYAGDDVIALSEGSDTIDAGEGVDILSTQHIIKELGEEVGDSLALRAHTDDAGIVHVEARLDGASYEDFATITRTGTEGDYSLELSIGDDTTTVDGVEYAEIPGSDGLALSIEYEDHVYGNEDSELDAIGTPWNDDFTISRAADGSLSVNGETGQNHTGDVEIYGQSGRDRAVIDIPQGYTVSLGDLTKTLDGDDLSGEPWIGMNAYYVFDLVDNPATVDVNEGGVQGVVDQAGEFELWIEAWNDQSYAWFYQEVTETDADGNVSTNSIYSDVELLGISEINIGSLTVDLNALGAAARAYAYADDPNAMVNEGPTAEEEAAGEMAGPTATGDQDMLLVGADGFDDVAEYITGAAGSDVIMAMGGDNRIDGGTGRDMVSYEDADRGIDLDLFLTGAQDTGVSTDTLRNVESVMGTDYGDVIDGNGRDNTIHGMDGDDVLDGGLGDDVLSGGYGDDIIDGGLGDDVVQGGAGADTLTGGLGADTFAIDTTDAIKIAVDNILQQNDAYDEQSYGGYDHIVDFNTRADNLVIEHGYHIDGVSVDVTSIDYHADTGALMATIEVDVDGDDTIDDGGDIQIAQLGRGLDEHALSGELHNFEGSQLYNNAQDDQLDSSHGMP
ncbi:Ig-like domain-containing protein [Rhodobacteraceae bacterium nBUS_24]